MEAVPRSIAVLRHAVADCLAGAGVPESRLADVKLAVWEAVTNAVTHAYVGAPRPGPVHVRTSIEDETVLVEVSDEGRGMVPRDDSPGFGVGLALLAEATDALEIGRAPRGGTQLRMAFRRGCRPTVRA